MFHNACPLDFALPLAFERSAGRAKGARSDIHGMPSGRDLTLALGMFTRRNGLVCLFLLLRKVKASLSLRSGVAQISLSIPGPGVFFFTLIFLSHNS